MRSRLGIRCLFFMFVDNLSQEIQFVIFQNLFCIHFDIRPTLLHLQHKQSFSLIAKFSPRNQLISKRTSWEFPLRTKSSPKVSQFSTGFSWRLTPPSCRQSAQMVNLIDVAPRSMVLVWRWPNSAKKGPGRSRCEVGRPCRGDRWTFFRGNTNVHSPPRAGRDPRCPGAVAHSCQVVVDAPMGFSLGLRCGPGVRSPWATC